MMERKGILWTLVCMLVLGVGVNADLTLVENFEDIAVETWLNGTTSAGPLGGYWDVDDEGGYHSQRTAKVFEESAGGNRFTRMESRSNDFRTATISDLADPIDESETGVLFFRFKAENPGSRLGIDFSFGLHALTGTDPVTRTNGDDPANYIAGFTVQGDIATGFNIATIDGTALTTTPLAGDSWYDVWIVADNAADTFDLYVSATAAAGGEPGLPTGDAIATGLDFNVATTDSLTGFIYTNNLDSTGWLSNAIVDDIWWDGAGVVPEPATLALLLSGTVLLRRRK